MFCGGRMIEQDQVPHGLGYVLDLGGDHVAGDRAQRQIVKLDVAIDVRVDAGGNIFQRLPGQLHFAAAHVEHHAGANRGKADHGGDRRGNQEFCG
jgi:hypothetical protein